MESSLYQRLGGYDAIVAVVEDFLPKLTGDPKLRRFWDHRGDDGVAREKQLLIDFMCHSAGGPMVYTGRDMTTTHKGMNIDDEDWSKLVNYLGQSLDHFNVPEKEKDEVLGFVLSLKGEIVDA